MAEAPGELSGKEFGGTVTSVRYPGAMHVEVDGRRISLTRAGIEKASRETPQLGEKSAGAVRAAVDRAIDSNG